MNKINFKLMSFFMERMKKPEMVDTLLNAVMIKENQEVLDYACGPGIFTIKAAEIVGDKGHVYAADIEKTAKLYIEKKANKNNISNISTIVTSCHTGLKEKSIDRILFFDVIHHVDNLKEILSEFERIIKPDGYLAVDVHHILPEQGRDMVFNNSNFKLVTKFDNTNPFLNRLFLFQRSVK